MMEMEKLSMQTSAKAIKNIRFLSLTTPRINVPCKFKVAHERIVASLLDLKNVFPKLILCTTSGNASRRNKDR